MIRVGQKLHDARIHKSLTLEEIASATKIRPRFITAIERGEYDKLPSAAYAQGFVSNYTAYLGLPQKEMLALFRREFDDKKHYNVIPNSFKNKGFRLTRVRIRQSFVVLALGLFALLFYLGFQYRAMFLAPSITVDFSKQNTKVGQDYIIKGKTDPYVSLYINSKPVSVDSNGEFTKSLSLFSGKNSIVIKAKNRFGKESILQRYVYIEK